MKVSHLLLLCPREPWESTPPHTHLSAVLALPSARKTPVPAPPAPACPEGVLELPAGMVGNKAVAIMAAPGTSLSLPRHHQCF